MNSWLPAIAVAIALPALTTPAASSAGTLDIPGGALDPAFPDADVYLDPPKSAEPEGRACKVAAHYVELVNAGKYGEIAALYAEDASLLDPMRPSSFGREQINAFYSKRIGAMQPHVRAVAYLGDDTDCFVDLALQTEIAGRKRFVLVSVDHFTLREDGLIASMVAFARPARAEEGELGN